MKMELFAKGAVFEELKGTEAGSRFSISDGVGFCVLAGDDSFLSEYDIHNNLKFTCTKFNNVIMLCIKFGDKDWFSAPFNPNLQEDFTLKEYKDSESLPVTILLVNNANGIIRDMRLTTFNHDFSVKLNEYCRELLNPNFNVEDQYKEVAEIYNKYQDDKALSKTASCYCNIDVDN